ncbi:MAG: acyl-CoA dehydrogenase family protein, partial [Pseudomonadota bacterium]
GAEPDILKSRIIAETFAATGLPRPIANQGVSMLVPTLLELGTEAQKQAFIPPTLRGEMIWCQGYSEPGSGSDLASLKTKAVIDGDDYVINGQKIWTSTAKQADMIFCLVRTEADAPKHKGISYLLFSMETPGIEVRPLVDMTGAANFNEVFFTDVRVPRTSIVGQPGEGWSVANATLTHERGMLGDPNAAKARLLAIAELMQSATLDGRRLIEDPVMRDRLVALQARVYAMQANGMRLTTSRLKGERAGLAGLIVKLEGCELNHELARLAIDALGEIGILYEEGDYLHGDGEWQWKYMYDLGLIIGGGTAQIQKNIIGERGLGLPREPKPAA